MTMQDAGKNGTLAQSGQTQSGRFPVAPDD